MLIALGALSSPVPRRRVLHDEYFKKAKAEGYLARSAYKLLEIQDRFRVLHPGDRVLDLGCAPGSWLQVAEKVVGPTGVIVGIDLSPVEHRFGPRVRVIGGDAFTTDPAAYAALADEVAPAAASPRSFDAVLSDMAPSTSGHGDDLLSARLCRRVLEVARAVLRLRGNLVMKILEGAEYPAVLEETRAMFARVQGFKPKASRDASREMFIVALGRRS